MIDYKKKYLKYKKKYLMAKKMYGGGRRNTLQEKKRTLEGDIQKYKVLKDQGKIDAKDLPTVNEKISKWEQEIEEINQEIAEINGKNKELTPETDKSEGWAPWLWDKGTSIATESAKIGAKIAASAATSGVTSVANLTYDKIYTPITDRNNYIEEIKKLLDNPNNIEEINKIYEKMKKKYKGDNMKLMIEQINSGIKTYLNKYKKEQNQTHWYEVYIKDKSEKANEKMKTIIETSLEKKYTDEESYAEALDIKQVAEGKITDVIGEHVRKNLLEFLETTSGYGESFAPTEPTTIENIKNTFETLSEDPDLSFFNRLTEAISPDSLWSGIEFGAAVVGDGASAGLEVAASFLGGQKTIKKN